MHVLFVMRAQTDFQLWIPVLKLKSLPHLGRNKPETLNIDCWHLMEAIGIAIWSWNCIGPIAFHWKSMGSQKKTIPVSFFLDFLLPYQLCYGLIHYFTISSNFKVFSIQWYQWYPYPGFWAWVTGSLLWACQSDRKWRKIDPSLKKFEIKLNIHLWPAM